MIRFENTANCTTTDPEIFFSESRGAYPEQKAMRKICGACDALNECRDYALNNTVLGFWGNTTEKERRFIRKQLNITPKPYQLGEYV